MMLGFLLIIALYATIMLSLSFGFNKVMDFKFENSNSHTPFSIIIPFRNEAENLPVLLDSIQELNYPNDLVEFILVDDDSSDNSVQIIEDYFQIADIHSTQLGISIITNNRTSNSPKKDAIQTAIKKAKHEWIITTDADCIVPENWLTSFDLFIQNHDAVMVAGPVTYIIKNSFLETLQEVEFKTLQVATIGGFGIGKPMMCNGANLAYRKSVFEEVKGFEGNNTIASGDDVFLFEKMYKRYTNRVFFLKSKAALVTTNSLKTWKGFIHQRVRWAAKSSNYSLNFTKIVGSIVLITNLSLVIGLFLAIFEIFTFYFYACILVSKIIIDTSLLWKFYQFFEDEKSKKMYFITGFVYPFISVYIMLRTLNTGYSWKERSFKK